jgi:hypothetical protein
MCALKEKARLKGDPFEHEKGAGMFIDCSDISPLRA